MEEEWTVSTLKEHLDLILSERDRSIREILKSSADAISRIEENINTIRADHVTRTEFNELKNSQQQSRGARNAYLGVLGIVVTLIAVALGSMYDRQLTLKDVREQIEHDTPWAKDKQGIEDRLRAVEQNVLVLQSLQGKSITSGK